MVDPGKKKGVDIFTAAGIDLPRGVAVELRVH